VPVDFDLGDLEHVLKRDVRGWARLGDHFRSFP
jgi:hypothetical protein